MRFCRQRSKLPKPVLVLLQWERLGRLVVKSLALGGDTTIVPDLNFLSNKKEKLTEGLVQSLLGRTWFV